MYAVRQVVSGRRVGSRLNVRDLMSPVSLTTGRVSQLRRELQASWQALQGETVAA